MQCMSLPANLVTIHPYFKVHAGKWSEVEEVLKEFVATTRSEPLCLFYEFTVNGDEVFCREGYIGAEGTLAHLQNVGAVIEKMLKFSDMTKLEFHGPAAEIDRLREPLAHLEPAWFVLHSGLERS
jgi:quinol monooxygenase YgiN